MNINLIGDIQNVFSDLLLMLEKSILMRRLFLPKHYKTSYTTIITFMKGEICHIKEST